MHALVLFVHVCLCVCVQVLDKHNGLQDFLLNICSTSLQQVISQKQK